MINLTFASLKSNKETFSTKQHLSKKHDLAFSSFKVINNSEKDKPNDSSNVKKLENQQNTFHNLQSSILPRKNIVKVDKSGKKFTRKVLKSPLYKKDDFVSPISTNNNNYKVSKGISLIEVSKSIVTSRTENRGFQVMLTPSLQKNSSFITDQHFNSSFFTQKNSLNSDFGSISSNKNSINDSFQRHQLNLSIDEDLPFVQKSEKVNSSMQIFRDIPPTINEFPESDLKTMKKSHYLFNTGHSDLKEVDIQSNASKASSITSMKFSDKFKHHKKKRQLAQLTSSKERFKLSDFHLVEEIGSGKYGKVHFAIHSATGFVCAIKSISKHLIKNESLETALVRQIKIQLYLNHPNIVQLYGIFHDKENTYLIMEYCSDHHLLSFIKKRQQILQTEILLILSNVFEAVSYLHCNGVIHRDIKPQNIVIEHGTFKLCDFGWAAYSCGDSRKTFCGTPLYVCPQVLKGDQYNQKADIWGLGIITYQLLFGRVPFPIMNQRDMVKIVSDPVYFPFWTQASEKLKTLVKSMLNKNPKERPTLNEILASQLMSSFRDLMNMQLEQSISNIFKF